MISDYLKQTEAVCGNKGQMREADLKIVKNMPQSRVRKLELAKSQRGMIKEISEKKYTNILCFSGVESKIYSIEGLSRVFMPSIQHLWIDNNYIRTIRDLKKANLPQLSRIGIQNNYILDAGSLVESNLPNLHWLFMSIYINTNAAVIDPRFPAKLQTKTLDFIKMNEKNFCIKRYSHSMKDDLVMSIRRCFQRKWHVSIQ